MSRICCYAAMLHEPDQLRGLSPCYLKTTMSGKPGLFFKDTNRLRTTYSLRGVPALLPKPVAAVRFRKEQLGEGMPNWDPQHKGKLDLASLPGPRGRCLFMLKTQPSGNASTPRNTSSERIQMIEEDMWQSFSRSHEHLAGTHKIWRIGQPLHRTRLEELANVLQHDDFWVHEQSHVEASIHWSSLSLVYDILTGLGSFELHVVTLNIENMTNDLATALVFCEVHRLDTSFHVAMGRRYGHMLDLEGNDDKFPIWIDFTIDELATTIEELEGSSQSTLDTDLRKWVYATNIPRVNKGLKYQSRLDTQQLVPLSESALRETLTELVSGNPDSREWKTQHRNATTKD
jgi:hypothetical protein